MVPGGGEKASPDLPEGPALETLDPKPPSRPSPARTLSRVRAAGAASESLDPLPG